jgi:hypothetical protein
MAPSITRPASVNAQYPRYLPKVRIEPSERADRYRAKYPAMVIAVAGSSARK